MCRSWYMLLVFSAVPAELHGDPEQSLFHLVTPLLIDCPLLYTFLFSFLKIIVVRPSFARRRHEVVKTLVYLVILSLFVTC